MSKGNVEVVRRIWEAADRQDREAVFALYDSAVVLDNSTVPGPLVGTYRGHEGVRQFSEEWRESFEAETYRARAETFIDAGERVVVGVRLTARGKASGANVEMPRWNVYTVRDGRVTRIDIFASEDRALEAAGLDRSAPARENVEVVRQALEAFEEIHWQPDRFFAMGDTVVVLGRVSVRGRGSGAVAESRRAWVCTLREGKIIRQQTYSEQQEALEAVGLG